MTVIDIERTDGSIVKCDTINRTLSFGRYHVYFTNTEFKILSCLYQKRGQVVTREELQKLIWADEPVTSTRSIDVHISSIRKKLHYIRGAKINCVYGKGYTLLMLNRF